MNERYLQVTNLSLDVGERIGRIRHVGEHHPLLIVVFAEDFVVAEVKAVADAESVAEGERETGK